MTIKRTDLSTVRTDGTFHNGLPYVYRSDCPMTLQSKSALRHMGLKPKKDATPTCWTLTPNHWGISYLYDLADCTIINSADAKWRRQSAIFQLARYGVGSTERHGLFRHRLPPNHISYTTLYKFLKGISAEKE